MTENWDAYFANLDGELASIFVDLGLHEAAPLASHPWVVCIHLQMLAPREDGLSSSEEFNVLVDVEKAILATFKGLDAVYPGRITSGGKRLMLLYVPKECDPEPLVREALADFPEYSFEAWCEEEPDWHFYLHTLYPRPEEHQTIKNRNVLEVLEEHGDALAAAREVSHWIYFAEKADRDAFIESVKPFGYSCATRDDSPGERPFMAELKRVDKVDGESIDEVTLQLFRLANHHDGEYDGWETQVVAEPAAPAPGLPEPASKRPWWKRLFGS